MSSHINANNLRYDKDYQSIQRSLHGITSKFKTSVLEFAFVVSFIINLLVGNLLHVISTKEEVYNYFNDKGNVFNQLFVKKGWAWTTIVIVVFYVLTFLKKGHALPNKTKVVSRAIFNYFIVTVWWIFFTQWFFGLPIMDRVFVFTGGKCMNISEERFLAHKLHPTLFEKLEEAVTSDSNMGMYQSSLITSYVCRKLKGSWEGGHDPSGHVFLLIHSSLYLVFESLPYWNSWGQFKLSLQELKAANSTTSGRASKIVRVLSGHPHLLIIALVALWWWMLFMTSLYFHSIAEKFVGLIFGYVVFGLLYYLPRWLTKGKQTNKQKSY